MKKCTETEHFLRWPFVAGELRSDGERNNGGIDLIAFPEKIDIVHEATDENGLRPLLLKLNGIEGRFMSLGSASGLEDSFYHSYLEFTFRDAEIARSEEKILALHRQWLTWLDLRKEKNPGYEEAIAAIAANIVWEYRQFSFKGQQPQYLITVYSRSRSAADHCALIGWLDLFLEMVSGTEVSSV